MDKQIESETNTPERFKETILILQKTENYKDGVIAVREKDIIEGFTYDDYVNLRQKKKEAEQRLL